jgi:hypothetical protein
MIAVGTVKFVLYKVLITQGTRIALIVACSFHSFEAVAASQIAVSIVAVAVSRHFLRRSIGLTWADMASATRPSAAVTAMSMAGPALVAIFYPPAPDLVWSPFLLAVATGALGWLAGVYVVGHPVRDELEILFRKTWSLVASPHRV